MRHVIGRRISSECVMREFVRSWLTSWIAIGGRLGRRGRLLEFGKLNLNERFAGKMGSLHEQKVWLK